MLIADAVTRLAASLLSILRTRAELVAAEVEEESLRYFTYLMLSLGALFCLGVALILATLLLLVLFWDSHRVGILLSLIVLFGAAAALLTTYLRRQYRAKSPLLVHTLHELSRDTDMLQTRP